MKKIHKSSKPRIDLMQQNDFEEINKWCIDEGWNLGLNDSQFYYKLDPKGHFILKNQNPIASLSLVKQAPSFFSLGPFIVKKEYRHQGLGNLIWDHGMGRVQKEYTNPLIVLYAVEAQVERYKSVGFVPYFNNQRWYLEPQTIIPPQSTHCYPITEALFKQVAAFDEAHYYAPRPLLFLEMLQQANVIGFAYIKNHTVKGFGLARPCIRGYRIGPLIADSKQIAQALLSNLLHSCHQETAFIDAPCCNPLITECLSHFNGIRKPEEDTVTMIKGLNRYTQFPNRWNLHYGLFSLEIG